MQSVFRLHPNLTIFSQWRETGKRWCSKYFITTPIFYVNAEPHIGHLYTAVIGDAAKRFQKLKNPNLKTKFMVGTDEHGMKVKQSADALKVDVKTFCDQVSEKYRNMFHLFDVDYDDFVRTTEERHEKAAVALWNKLFSKNLIYGETYSGWYCMADEVFVPERFLSPQPEENGIRFTLEGNKPVQFAEEYNYKFNCSCVHDDLLHWLKGDVIKPNIFKNDVIKLIEDEVMSTVSVSRPTSRVPWGIPVPGDPTQTIYVWMDALASYLCANGYPESDFKWPPDVQIIGKDIVKFHAVFWPALLIAADLEPPRWILCHSHWLKDYEKISKSKGNVLSPFKLGEKFTEDGLRFFLLRVGVAGSDGNFCEEYVSETLNSDLADTIGNLLSRCTGSSLNPNQIFPSLFEGYEKYLDATCEELIKVIEGVPEEVSNHFEELDFHKGLELIMKVMHTTNKFFQDREPWKVKKDGRDLNHVVVSLHFTMEALRVCGILLQPIIPGISNKILTKLSIPKNKRSLSDIRPYSWELSEVSKVENLELGNNSSLVFTKIKA